MKCILLLHQIQKVTSPFVKCWYLVVKCCSGVVCFYFLKMTPRCISRPKSAEMCITKCDLTLKCVLVGAMINDHAEQHKDLALPHNWWIKTFTPYQLLLWLWNISTIQLLFSLFSFFYKVQNHCKPWDQGWITNWAKWETDFFQNPLLIPCELGLGIIMIFFNPCVSLPIIKLWCKFAVFFMGTWRWQGCTEIVKMWLYWGSQLNGALCSDHLVVC